MLLHCIALLAFHNKCYEDYICFWRYGWTSIILRSATFTVQACQMRQVTFMLLALLVLIHLHLRALMNVRPMQHGFTSFEPHFMHRKCDFPSQRSCDDECINHGRYCAFDSISDQFKPRYQPKQVGSGSGTLSECTSFADTTYTHVPPCHVSCATWRSRWVLILSGLQRCLL